MVMAQLVTPPPVPAQPHHSPAGGAFAHFMDEETKGHTAKVLSWEAVAGCKGCFSSTLKQRVPGPNVQGWPVACLPPPPTLPGDAWVSRFRDSSSEALTQQLCSGLVKTLE